MNQHFSLAIALAALTIPLGGALQTAKATDVVFPGCWCTDCACGDLGVLGCGLCDCGYMRPVYRAQCYNWNGRYAHSAYGQPVALVVPPTANLQTNWGWGVSSSRISRLDHQVQRNYPGPGPFGGPYRRTPAWPSDTTQFGVYYVRGPW